MKLVATAALCMMALATNAGIYRHDKPKKAYTDLAKQPQFDCVAQLYWKGERIGSCVLVGDKYVLSAAHCFLESLTKEDTIYQGTRRVVMNVAYGEYVRDPEQYTVVFKGKKYHSKTIHIYPDYLKHDMSHKCDIALLELTEPVKGVTPAKLCKSSDELHSPMVGVGFGAHGIANQPENVVATAEKIAGENTIDSICGYIVNGQPISMLCDFDHPTNTKHNSMGSATPQPLEYIPSGGDSGGGAFRKTAMGWELIGICGSSGYGGIKIDILTTPDMGYYGQQMEWQRVSVFANWIEANEK